MIRCEYVWRVFASIDVSTTNEDLSKKEHFVDVWTI
jgi:hypothetical protein